MTSNDLELTFKMFDMTPSTKFHDRKLIDSHLTSEYP